MKEFTYTIKEPVGIHARPAGMLAKEAKTCQSTVTIVDSNGNVLSEGESEYTITVNTLQSTAA